MIIDGKKIASKIELQIKEAVGALKGRPPGLAFILVGENPASKSYIKMKKQKCKEVGIFSVDREFSDSVTEEHLLNEIAQLNQDPEVDGILVQLPLPDHINAFKVLESIDPKKDVDGFHPINAGKLLLGDQDGFFPCTPLGIIILLAQSNIQTEGKHVVVLGRSNIVGKPLAAMLMQKRAHANATVTVSHSQTKNLKEICKSADILIAAIGKAKFVKADMIKEGCVVIDVGINRIVNQTKGAHLVGDVDYEQVAPRCSHITPVPGGVGPMTIAMLLSNTLLSYQRRFS